MCSSTPSARLALPGTVEAPLLARTFVTDVLCPEHGSHAVDAARLLVSELVTHAAMYGAPPISVVVDCQVVALRLEVWDSGDSDVSALDPDGRLRLLLIEKIARERGVRHTEQGTLHWCTVSTGVLPG